VCGYLGCDARPFNPVLQGLPRLLHARAADGAECMTQLIRLAVDETAARRSGGETVLSKVAELMFVDVVRRHIEALPPGSGSWLSGLRDNHVGAALARIAVDKHRDVVISEGDLVLHAARAIPGNDRTIGRMFNHLLRRGASVVTAEDAPIHVSGHPRRDELALLIHLLRPKFLLPIHGEYRQLVAHADVGRRCGLDADSVLLAESGDLMTLTDDEFRRAERVPVGQVFIDGALDRVDFTMLRDRRQIAGDGIVVAVVAVDRESGLVAGKTEISSRGFVSDAAEEALLEEARDVVASSLVDTSLEERSDEGLLKAKIQAGLRRFLRKRTQKRPLIIPVIVEL
jgi:ribonuclease J